MRGGTTLYLEFPFWKLPLLIISAFKGVNFQKCLFTPPLGGILGPFSDECDCLGDAALLTVVGLLKAALDGDDPLWARHLELQVCVAGDDHEHGEARSIEDCVVDAGEVNDLKGEWLLVEIVWLAKGDIEPDASKGYDFLPRHDPVEWRLAGA